MKTGELARRSLIVVLVLFAGCRPRGAGRRAEQPRGRYLREQILDTRVGRDEALVNVRLAADGWPDCYSLKSAIGDIWRLEGVSESGGQEKALALWKWFRILVSGAKGAGGYVYEGRRNKPKPVFAPHRIFTCYGHHQCDGQSWAMTGLWQAAGMMALDECHWGHTAAALRYRDRDGHYRYHVFDPQRKHYHWDPVNGRVGTWKLPVMTGTVFRHLVSSRRVHSLRTSLRVGERLVRSWENRGYVIPAGRDIRKALKKPYYAWKPGRSDGVYAAVGEEAQVFEPGRDPARYAAALFDGSANAAFSPSGKGRPALHPAEAGKPAFFVYRLASPYPVADARVEVKMIKSDPQDICRLWISTDGKIWRRIVEQVYLGEKQYALNIGRDARFTRRPDVYSSYSFMLKVECSTKNEVRSVGVRDLRVTAWRQLSKRVLPHLRPGGNVLRLTADRLADGLALELELDYSVGGKPLSIRQLVGSFPHYFEVRIPPDVPETVRKRYDESWNDGAVRMSSIRMRLVPREGRKLSLSMPADEAGARFAGPRPHPADLSAPKPVKVTETDPAQTSGFFPQRSAPRKVAPMSDAKMRELIAGMDSKDYKVRWRSAEELGGCPRALPALLEKLPGAGRDLTLFICKALAEIKDRRAVGPLLEKWKQPRRRSPGTRHIPDVLAVIGDRRAVPHLVGALPKLRFDFRLHVARALGILGGRQAETALEDMAKNDPFAAVREEAARALERLRAKD